MARVIITTDGRVVRLRPVRLHRLTGQRGNTSLPQPQKPPTPSRTPNVASARHLQIQPLPSGQTVRVVSPPEQALVTPVLARELGQALEQFAQANGFTQEKPLTVFFHRGTLGLHRSNRAADIYGVGGKGIGQWALEWNAAMRRAKAAPNAEKRERIIAEEKARNLGHKLYKALQAHGGWAQPPGYPVQLFGPWTRDEGPHKAISDRMLYAHRDHIHVAR